MNNMNENYALGAREIQQTILILNLSVAQIELSITDGDHSVNALIDSFKYMSQHIEEIKEATEKMGETGSNSTEFQDQYNLLQGQTSELGQKIQQAIIAFQFYDKLTQRLEHVSYGLSGLSEIVSHEMKVKNVKEWEAFKSAVRRGTTMREEEELFELIFDQKIPPAEAIETMKQRMLGRMHQKAEEQEDIELF